MPFMKRTTGFSVIVFEIISFIAWVILAPWRRSFLKTLRSYPSSSACQSQCELNRVILSERSCRAGHDPSQGSSPEREALVGDLPADAGSLRIKMPDAPAGLGMTGTPHGAGHDQETASKFDKKAQRYTFDQSVMNKDISLNQLEDLLKTRLVFLDGAMGTMIQRYKLREADFRGSRFLDHPKDLIGNNDLLSLVKPEVIKEIHTQYLEAGSDIIETNTFSSTDIGQADYGLEPLAYELNVASARIAKEAVRDFTQRNPDRTCFVAGRLAQLTEPLHFLPMLMTLVFAQLVLIS